MQIKSIAECCKGGHSEILSTFIKLPFVGCLCLLLLCFAVVSVLLSFAISFPRKWELVALLNVCNAVVPWVALGSVNVAFADQSHLVEVLCRQQIQEVLCGVCSKYFTFEDWNLPENINHPAAVASVIVTVTVRVMMDS